MKWTNNIPKLKLFLFLSIVFLIGKTLKDEKNVLTLAQSFSSVYEDRLVVESYIYQLADQLYQKRIALEACSNFDQWKKVQFELNTYTQAIDGLLSDYEKTQLTPNENLWFTKLKENMTNMQDQEREYAAVVNNEASYFKLDMDDEFMEASKYLNLLSTIQITEGKALNDSSKKIVAGSILLNYLELAIVITIALIIYMLIFVSRSNEGKIIQQSHLN